MNFGAKIDLLCALVAELPFSWPLDFFIFLAIWSSPGV
jgi:hypothetical protein